MKLITLESLKVFLDELNKKYGMEFYTKTEIDRKLKGLSGTTGYTQEQVDALLKDMERRIPNYQYEVKLTQKPHQTITATVGEKTYTQTFLISRGADVTFSVKADPGYIAGSLSVLSAHVVRDIEITVTDVTVNEEVEPSSVNYDRRSGEIVIPPAVSIIQITFGEKSIYLWVPPESRLECMPSLTSHVADQIPGQEAKRTYTLRALRIRFKSGGMGEWIFDDDFAGIESPNGYVTISWSDGINKHPYDYKARVKN